MQKNYCIFTDLIDDCPFVYQQFNAIELSTYSFVFLFYFYNSYYFKQTNSWLVISYFAERMQNIFPYSSRDNNKRNLRAAIAIM